MAKAIARSGHGCDVAQSGPRCDGCFGLMRETDLLAPGRVGSPAVGRGTTTAPSSPRRWTRCGEPIWTTTVTGEGPAAVFVAVDHCSAECVGVHAHSRARFEALEPIRQGVRRHFGGFAQGHRPWSFGAARPWIAHTCRTSFQKEIGFLGIKEVRPPSSARPRVTAALNGSSGRSRKTCCGCATSRRSRNCADSVGIPRGLQHRPGSC